MTLFLLAMLGSTGKAEIQVGAGPDLFEKRWPRLVQKTLAPLVLKLLASLPPLFSKLLAPLELDFDGCHPEFRLY